jgi:serine/threonine protein phosphatase PrpC
VRSALLRGREHTEIGEVAVEAEERAAVALSRGGASKVYPHRDPNEDAAVFALGPGGVVLAVADAHDGFAASEVALDHLLHHPVGQWTAVEPLDPDAWARHALAALLDANRAILAELDGTEPPGSCTTLALAVVRPAEGRVLFASIGDSHLFLAGPGDAVDLGARATRSLRRELGSFFLGFGPESEESLSHKARIGVEPLSGTRAVLLATDGLSEGGIGVADPRAEVTSCVARATVAAPEVRALVAARGLVEAALDAHVRCGAGDNVAAAVAWCLPRPAREPAR